MKITREVVKDLLPAYFSEEASADTRSFVSFTYCKLNPVNPATCFAIESNSSGGKRSPCSNASAYGPLENSLAFCTNSFIVPVCGTFL